MSGILAIVSKQTDVKERLLKGIKLLEFEKHDSTGISVLHEDCIKSFRVIGKVGDLRQNIPQEVDSHIGIAHTRDSLRNEQSIANVYPITSQNHKVTIVVNGMVDNIKVLKNQLIYRGYKFSTDSAVEIVANLLDEEILKGKNPLAALKKVGATLEGSFAIVGIFYDDPETLYFIKNKSVLIISRNENSHFISSSYAPVGGEAKEYYIVDDKELGCVQLDNISVFDAISGKKKQIEFTSNQMDEDSLELEGYPHYMLKEIEEAPRVIRRVIDKYYDGVKYTFDQKLIDRIINADSIVFLAEGTSYHASLIGARYLRNYNKKVDVYLASEWAFYPYRASENTLYILMSQSGETSDLLRCVEVIRDYNNDFLSVTNVETSTLYREGDYKLLLYAGTEVSVASTKAYIAQLTILSLLYARLVNKDTTIIALNKVAKAVEEIIKNKKTIEEIAKVIAKHRDIYFLGRGFDADFAFEAALKMKETTYIHAEAYPGGQILHGPMALIEDGTPVVVFVSDLITSRAMREVIATLRKNGANVVVCSSDPLQHPGDSFVVPIVKGYHSPLLLAVFAQYLAYFTAVKLGRDVDRPRNLSKEVVVDNAK